MIPYSGPMQEWNRLITSLPGPHLLQTRQWSDLKAKYGWQPLPFTWNSEADGRLQAAAMLLKRSLTIRGFAPRLNVLYIPKGPLLDWQDADLRRRVLADLASFASRQGAIFIKIDPDVELGRGIPGSDQAQEFSTGHEVQLELEASKWQFSRDQIQFRNTVLIDLSVSEQDLLNRMKQKTRYNQRLAQKKGVQVRIGNAEDLPVLYRMYAETSIRDGFLIREQGYYRSLWQAFLPQSPVRDPIQPFFEPLIAEVDGEIVAAVSVFYFAGTAVYLLGMSTQAAREKMPNYLLQWEAVRRAKALGCATYNLWGAPDVFNETDDLWGVFRFKEGLGGFVSRTIGAWDFTPSPQLYWLYTRLLPRMMDLLRLRGNARTRQALS